MDDTATYMVTAHAATGRIPVLVIRAGLSEADLPVFVAALRSRYGAGTEITVTAVR